MAVTTPQSPGSYKLAAQFLDALSTDDITSDDVTSQWNPELLAALSEELSTIQLQAGQKLFSQNDIGESMYLLINGNLAIHFEQKDGLVSEIDKLESGAIVGEMALVTHQRRSTTVRALSDSELLSLTKSGFNIIGEKHAELVAALADAITPRLHRIQLTTVLNGIFGDLDSTALKALQEKLKWSHLNAGQYLIKKGDKGDSLYIVVLGLLKAVQADENGGYRVLSEIGRGETVGEIALIIEEPRTADVIAARKSSVVRLSVEDFRELILLHPNALLKLSGRVIKRLREDASSALDRQTQLAVALLGDNPHVDIAPLGRRLLATLERVGPTLYLSAATFEEKFGRAGVAQYEGGGPLELAIFSWLDDQQTHYQFVIFEADRDWTPWSQRCLHQVDRLLIVADATHDPAVGRLEAAGAELVPHCRRELVLLQPENVKRPLGTLTWLQSRTVAAHHHVRLNNDDDIVRLGRRLTGRPVGLVLSGGGARGNAHVGTLMALLEADVPIDLIGGTSMGSLIGGLIALDMQPDEIMAFAAAHSSRSHLVDLTLPISAVTAGQRVTEVYQKLFGDVQIEDLWRPYFAVSCNLNTAMPVVHQTGPLWRCIRSSTAIPGIYPPILDAAGELLTDGGVINNMPTDVMYQLCEGGIVIGSNASPQAEATRGFVFGDHLSGWQTVWSRINPLAQSPAVPSLFETIMRSVEVMSIYSRREGRWDGYVDLMINLPVEPFNLLDFDRYQEIVEAGYEAAKEALAEWERPAF